MTLLSVILWNAQLNLVYSNELLDTSLTLKNLGNIFQPFKFKERMSFCFFWKLSFTENADQNLQDF